MQISSQIFFKCDYCRNIPASNDLLKCEFESLYDLNSIVILSNISKLLNFHISIYD